MAAAAAVVAECGKTEKERKRDYLESRELTFSIGFYSHLSEDLFTFGAQLLRG